MKKLSPTTRFVLIHGAIFVSINLVLPAIVAVLVPNLTFGGSFVYAFCVWAVLITYRVLHLLDSFKIEQERLERLVQLISDGDELLYKLQASLRKLATRRMNGEPNPVFQEYCRRRLDKCLSVIQKAAEHGELEVKDHHFSTVSTLLSAFSGSPDRTLRCVWLIEEGYPLFDEYWRQYMGQIVRLNDKNVANERIQIEILFVLDDVRQSKRIEFQTVLSFVSHRHDFKALTMSKDDYDSRMKDAGIANECKDFGIYGNGLLFKTISYDPHRGVFTDDVASIRQYFDMHRSAMESVYEIPLPKLRSDVSLDDFLNCDKGKAE